MTVLAHVAHWYHSLLYAAPIILIALALWWSGRRDGGSARKKGGDAQGAQGSDGRDAAAEEESGRS